LASVEIGRIKRRFKMERECKILRGKGNTSKEWAED